MVEDGKKVIFVGSIDMNNTEDLGRLTQLEEHTAKAGYGYNQSMDFELRLMAPKRYSVYVTGDHDPIVELFKDLKAKDLIKH